MNKTNDGGPAFPLQSIGPDFVPGYAGMTLRDYFAAKAMQGLLAAQVHGFNDQPAKGPFASMAYEMADAMLAAREM